MHDTEDHSGLSRRTVLAGAAWTVPAVVATSALPAYAASTTITTVSVVSFTGTTTPVATFRFATDDSSLVKAGTTATFSVTATRHDSGQVTLAGTASTGTGYTVSTPVKTSSGNVDTWTFTVNVTSDVMSPLNITFTLAPNSKSPQSPITSAAASVTTASTTPASNGSVSFSTTSLSWS